MTSPVAALIFLLLLAASPLSAAYKIIVSSHHAQEQANQTKIELLKWLQTKKSYKKYQEKEGFSVQAYPLQNYFIVTLEPIVGSRALSKLFTLIKKRYPAAFVSRIITKPLDTTAIPTTTTDSTAHNTTILSAKASTSEPERSKYLRNKKPAVDEEVTDRITLEHLYWLVALLFVLISLLSLWLWKLKKTVSQITTLPSATAVQAPVATPTLPVHVDLHSHLIPGIDDGVKTMEESLDILRRFQKLGYTKIITTPHIMSHRYANTAEILQKGLQQLRKRVQEEQIPIQVEIASEYYLDDHLMDLVARFDVLTFGTKKYLLFEMSYINLPLNLDAMIEVMQEAGYTPVLAHPERYVYLAKNFGKYRALKQLGVLFQLNINSLAGYYSDEVKHLAQRLVNEGMIDFVGSDVHHKRHMHAIEKVVTTSAYRDIFKKNNILNNTL